MSADEGFLAGRIGRIQGMPDIAGGGRRGPDGCESARSANQQRRQRKRRAGHLPTSRVRPVPRGRALANALVWMTPPGGDKISVPKQLRELAGAIYSKISNF